MVVNIVDHMILVEAPVDFHMMGQDHMACVEVPVGSHMMGQDHMAWVEAPVALVVPLLSYPIPGTYYRVQYQGKNV